jgi:hypothetical protein
MARAKWNPATGRFETAGGVDNPPNGFAPTGTQYVDTVTGQRKMAQGGAGPDIVLGNASPTTQPKAPKPTTPASPTTTGAPKGTTTSVPKPSNTKGGSTTSTTMAPKSSSPSTTSTMAPKATTTPTTVPTGPSAEALRRAGVNPAAAVENALQLPSDNSALIAAINAQTAMMSSGGSGTKTETPAELAAKYRANVEAANIQARAGATAQADYNAIGESAYKNATDIANPMFAQQTLDTNAFYNSQLEAIKKYYGEQNTQASKTISDAGATFLAGLPEATAFANAQVANLPQAQQGLTDALSAYGATGNKAQEVSTQDAAYIDAIAKLQTSANAQLSAADKAYMASLKTAGQGANTAAQQALAGNLAGLQAQDTSGVNAARRSEIGNINQNKAAATSDAEALRQQYISKGIEALMSGKQTAAATKAQAASDYGVPKKAKSKKTTKK